MNIRYFIYFIFGFFVINSISIYGQEDLQIGKSLQNFERYNGALFDYSDPSGVNIKVGIWGYVKFPGRYIIPAANTVNDLLTLAGGPTEDARLEDLKLLRMLADSTQTIMKLNYKDYLWTDSDHQEPLKTLKLNAGDILLVPGEPRFFLKDYLGITLSIVSTLSSIAVLLITIFRK